MIKINLLGDDTAIDNTANLIIAGYIASIGLTVGICFFVYTSVSSTIGRHQSEIERLEGRLTQLKKITSEVAGLETKKKELHDKLAVIATLKKSKNGPVRVLDDLNMSLPDKSWMHEVNERGDSFSIKGSAVDNQTIAILMKNLESSDYFSGVDLIETKLETHLGVKIKNFTINTKVSYAGKFERNAAEENTKPAAAPAAAKPATAQKAGEG